MNENDAMRMLSESNPARLADLSEAPNDVLASILVRRRRPRRRFVLAAAAATAALATSLIGIFALDGSRSPHVVPQRGGGQDDLAGPCCRPTVAHPLGLGAKRVSFAAATASLGVPIVLPDTPLIGRSDIGSVWMSSSPHKSVVVAAVTFPDARVFIDYETGLNRYYDDVLLLYRGMARAAPHSFHVIDVSGVPALASRENSDETGKNFGAVIFDAGGARVSVFGHYDQPTLRAVARSIVHRSQVPPPGQLGDVSGTQLFPYLPPAKRIEPANASAILGAPFVLPNSRLVKLSDAGQVWEEGSCLAPNAALGGRPACWVWVSFPSTRLSVGYLRPSMYGGTRAEWQLEARDFGKGAEVLDLEGVPALAIKTNGRFPASIEFDLGGNRIVVIGVHGTATLRAAAQSIVDRYPVPHERAPIVAQPTPTFAHPLGRGAQRIRLANAASTLGAPVVLPYRGFAHLADVGGVWGASEGARRAVAVTFPAKGLIIRYERPAYPKPRANYESFLRRSGGSASIVYLNGAPGLEVARTRGGSRWTSVEFKVRGTIVVVTARGAGVHLQRIAKSILYRARSQ